MYDVNFNNLLNSLLGLRHVSEEIRRLVEPAGAFERLAGILPLAVRWRRSRWSETAKRLEGKSGVRISPLGAAELELKVMLEEIVKQAERLPVSRDWVTQADRVKRNVNLSTVSLINTTLTRTIELHAHLMGELTLGRFYAIPSYQVGYMEDAAYLFGDTVPVAFRSAVLDMEEAGKCYALGRYTACVFHLMRVMEIGLRALGKTLNNPRLDPAFNPSWDSILGKCDDELRKPRGNRSPEWRTDGTFFSNATANLRAVKDAWRNPAIHVEINYDEERAADVMASVSAFMRHLATKLSE